MAKKAKKKTGKRKSKSTDWSLGQPLVFPEKKNLTDINLLAREVVEAAIGEPLRKRRRK
jgi:hypothetical protein